MVFSKLRENYNDMKKLSSKEMAELQGGISSCVKVLAGWGGTLLSVAMGNPIGVGIGLATMANWIPSCNAEGGFASMF
jgi:hypothetical protein